MSKASAIIRRLESEYNPGTFTGFSPLGKEMKAEINVVVKDIFDTLGGKSLLKPSGDVYIKPNAVKSRPYSHTRLEVAMCEAQPSIVVSVEIRHYS